MRSTKRIIGTAMIVAVGGVVSLAIGCRRHIAWAWSPPGRIQSRKASLRPPPGGLIFHRDQPKWDDDFHLEHFAFERTKCSSSLEAMSTANIFATSPDFLQVELVELQGDHNDADSFPRSNDSLWKLSFPKRSDKERIEQAYREWCEYYDKSPSETRHETFSTNFLAVQEFHDRTGRPLILNEFADMTEEEYRQHKSTMVGGSMAPPSNDRIRRAYREWCEYYGKVKDDKRFLSFAANFEAVDRYHRQTRKPLVLNEFADMTEEEYQRHLSTSSHFVASPDPKVLYEEEKTATGTNIIVNAHSIHGISQYNDEDPHNFSYSRVQEDPINYPLPTEGSFAASKYNQNALPPAYDSSLSAMNEVVARLQSTVSALSSVLSDTIADSLPSQEQHQHSNESPPLAQQQQPLDTLVIDVLQQQDETIAQLEDSVDGLRDVQAQSSDLIKMISQNQMQMAEMMSVVQREVSNLQADLRKSREGSFELMNRVRELEEKVAEYETRTNEKNDEEIKVRTKDELSLVRSLVLPMAPGSLSTQSPLENKRKELKPNPIGVMFRPGGITIGADSEASNKDIVDPLDEKITIRPIP